ncbi:DNA topoisomerase 2-associated protein pat1, partial [Coemansia sp. RSA 2704]
QQQGQQQAAGRGRVLTLAELEAQFAEQQQQQQQQQQQPPPPPQTQAAYSEMVGRADDATVARRRAARLQREAALARYDGMMSRRDKEHIVRIQVSQLLTDDPAADDFYSHMFRLSRGAAPSPQLAETASATLAASMAGRGRSGTQGAQGPQGSQGTQSSMARMQQQVQRIVNEARRRPKLAHVAAEGALGRISVNSARNPKQVIQVQRGGDSASTADARNPAAERRQTLRQIEAVYAAVLRLEQLLREQTRLPAAPEHAAVQQWAAAYAEARERAWAELGAAQPIMAAYPHPLARFLAVAKGKRVVPRLAHHLTADQTLALATTIIANFEALDVCRFGSFSLSAAARQRDETALFLHAVLPPALAFLADAPLQLVNGLLALFMERNNVAWVARTRPAQLFLAVVLRRSAALAPRAFAEEAFQAAELYSHLFGALRGHVASVFAPEPMGAQPGAADDAHAWQFLSALAASASVEQQHVLVAEARAKVLETVQLASRLPPETAAAHTANVNLFLNALGLDASQ